VARCHSQHDAAETQKPDTYSGLWKYGHGQQFEQFVGHFKKNVLLYWFPTIVYVLSDCLFQAIGLGVEFLKILTITLLISLSSSIISPFFCDSLTSRCTTCLSYKSLPPTALAAFL